METTLSHGGELFLVLKSLLVSSTREENEGMRTAPFLVSRYGHQGHERGSGQSKRVEDSTKNWPILRSRRLNKELAYIKE